MDVGARDGSGGVRSSKYPVIRRLVGSTQPEHIRHPSAATENN